MTQKNILITGASSGLGAALARAYAAQGHRLFLGGRDGARLQDVARICEKLGAEVHTQIADVEAASIMHQWIVGVDKRYPLDIVIANAGISGGTAGLAADEVVAQSIKIFDVNVGGVFNTINPILARMLARRAGQIVFISSMASFYGMPGAPAYSAAKAAVRMYGEALRGKYEKDGLKISVVCPGFIETPMTKANSFPMPFLMNPDAAAQKIVTAVHLDKALICFPLPFLILVRLMGFLPLGLRNRLLRRVPEKTPLQIF